MQNSLIREWTILDCFTLLMDHVKMSLEITKLFINVYCPKFISHDETSLKFYSIFSRSNLIQKIQRNVQNGL